MYVCTTRHESRSTVISIASLGNLTKALVGVITVPRQNIANERSSKLT